MWTRLSERVSQEHLQLQPQRPAFTCCERFFLAPYWLRSARSTRSKCQIWHCVGKECVMSMFANECFLQDLPALAAKLCKCGNWVCTYINSAARSNCKAASQRKWLRSIWQLQPSCPWFDLHAANAYQSSQLIRFCRIAPAVSLGSCSGSTSWALLVLFTHLNWRPRCYSQDDCSAFRTHSCCETDTVLCVKLYVHGSYSAMCERRLLKNGKVMYSQGDAQPSTDEGTANRSLFTCLSKLEVVSFWTHLLQLSALGTVQQSPAGSHYDWELQPLSNLVVSLEANIEERDERQLLMQSERRLWAKTALQWPHLRRAKKRNLIKWLALSITTAHWDHWSTLILYISKIWFPHGHFAQAYWASAQQREASSTQAFHNFWVWAFTSFSFESLLTPKDAKNVLKFLRQEISCILPMLDLHAEPAYNHSKGPGGGEVETRNHEFGQVLFYLPTFEKPSRSDFKQRTWLCRLAPRDADPLTQRVEAGIFTKFMVLNGKSY